MFIGLSTWMFMWSQIACSSSRLVEMTLPSLLLILYAEPPSLVNRRVMMMLLPYSLGLKASSPWFFNWTLTSATLNKFTSQERENKESSHGTTTSGLPE